MGESSEPQEGREADQEQHLGRRARKARATRSALFEAGLTAFENRPLGVVSVLDITEASDVAKGVFYLHFRGKDEYLIALWDFVQWCVLDDMRQKLAVCGHRAERIEAIVTYYHGMIARAPRKCRFWLRMSSYFGDEIGEPGQMSQLRQGYVRHLAALIGDASTEDVDPRELRVAAVLDGTCWGLISQAIQLGEAALDRQGFVTAATAAIRALSPDA